MLTAGESLADIVPCAARGFPCCAHCGTSTPRSALDKERATQSASAMATNPANNPYRHHVHDDGARELYAIPLESQSPDLAPGSTSSRQPGMLSQEHSHTERTGSWHRRQLIIPTHAAREHFGEDGGEDILEATASLVYSIVEPDGVRGSSNTHLRAPLLAVPG